MQKPNIKILSLAALLCMSLLGGCATDPSQCDPKNASFINNTACLSRGYYDDRLEAKQLELESAQRRNKAFLEMLSALEVESSQTHTKLQEREAQQRRLDRAWQQLQDALLDSKKDNLQLQRQIDRINQDLAQLNNSSSLAQAEKQQKRDELQRKLELLQREAELGLYE